MYLNTDDECILEAVRYARGQAVAPRPKTVYKVDLINPRRKIEAHLRFVPQMAAVRRSHGVVNDMFYYILAATSAVGSASTERSTKWKAAAVRP